MSRLRPHNSRPLRIAQIEQVILGCLIAAALSLFVVQGYAVSGACMQPYLYTGQRVLAYKMAYEITGPRRGDIVIFRYPRDPSQTFVKRVIGLPGDTIAITQGQVLIDGQRLREPYRIKPAHGDMPARFVPHDSYFVMGDNRDYSDDSRFWGDLPRADIVGRAAVCYWPPRACHVLR